LREESEKAVLALAHHYDEPVASGGVTYRARVYSAAQDDGMWSGCIVFFPVAGGRVIATERETTQSSLAQLGYWASGLTHNYLHGALERAISLQPEEQLARDLDQLERIEAAAARRAETLDAAAAAARTESLMAERARERTEDRFLASVANGAELNAQAHEAAAELSRKQARTAEGALRARRGGAPKKKK
jgi:hypothetical protein